MKTFRFCIATLLLFPFSVGVIHAQNEVVYFWSGAIQPTSAKVNAKLTVSSSAVRLVVSTNQDLSNPIYGAPVTANVANNLMAALSITGLAPNTRYYYGIESNGTLDNSPEDIGSFVTPGTGPHSFKFTLGSCLNSNTNHEVFNRMYEKDPIFFLSMGDFHYDNPNSATNISVHRMAYENNLLSKPNYNNFFKRYPLSYVWDDHDYSGNDSDSTAAGKANARQAYREYIPHYPFGTAIPGNNAPIYQAFTIGRVHFIMTDLRSTRRTPTMMGAIQKQWFKDQCIFAQNNGFIIAWVNSVSFGGNQSDNWGGFGAERIELANFFRDNDIKNMFLLSGDAHMVAIDNGTNHDFSTGGNNPNDYPVFQVAALNQGGSTKGGTYSEGVFPNPNNTYGQYGLVEVTDAGGSQIQIRMTAYRVTSAGVESQLVTYNFSRTLTVSLPVKFTAFKISPSADNSTAIVSWTAEEDTDCHMYEVEKSNNGTNFKSIAQVGCNGNNVHSYRVDDVNTFKGWNYYRIKSIGRDGREVFTAIRRIQLQGNIVIKLSLMADHSRLNIVISNAPLAADAEWFVYNADHRLILKGKQSILEGTNNFNIPTNMFSQGIYAFHIKMNGTELTKKFLKLQ